MPMSRITDQYKNVVKETSSKIGCLPGFIYHHLVIMSAHTHAHRYPLFESGTKTGLRTITLCRKDICSTII